MPATFSGIFYVSTINNRSLTCHLIDSAADTFETVVMTYYPPRLMDSAPFPEPLPVQPQHVYFISGFIAIQNRNYRDPLV